MYVEFIDGRVVELSDPPDPADISSIPQDVSVTPDLQLGLGDPYRRIEIKDTSDIPALINDSPLVRNKFILFRPFIVRSAIRRGEAERLLEHLRSLVSRFYERTGTFVEGGCLGEMQILQNSYQVYIGNVSRLDETSITVGECHIYDYGSLEGVGWGAHSPREWDQPLSGKVKGNLFSFSLEFEKAL